MSAFNEKIGFRWQDSYKNFTHLMCAQSYAFECNEPIKAYVKGEYLLVFPSGKTRNTGD